jgi:hypothetical protein
VATTEWRMQGVALLQAGRVWDAVRVAYELLADAGHAGDPVMLRHLLHTLQIGGPVFCDPFRDCVYVLVPPGTDASWPGALTKAGADCLGGTPPYIRHVGVPRLDRVSPPGTYWVIPPERATHPLTDPTHLQRVLHTRAARPRA